MTPRERRWVFAAILILYLATLAAFASFWIDVKNDHDRHERERDRNRELATCVRDTIQDALETAAPAYLDPDAQSIHLLAAVYNAEADRRRAQLIRLLVELDHC